MLAIFKSAAGVMALGWFLFLGFGWLLLDAIIWLLELLSKLH